MDIESTRLRDSSASVFALFTSAGTLVCCALPILLVSLGMGAAVVSLTSAAPWLITLSEHKIWVFGLSFLSLLLCAWFIYRPGRACPTDPALARQCQRLDALNRWIFWGSVAVWSTGFAAAFLLWPITAWLNTP